MNTAYPRGAHLHTHSDYSHDAFGSGSKRAKAAKALGHTHLALTDHGNENGIPEHLEGCIEEGLEGVAGIEIYYQHTEEIEKTAPRYHATILVMDNQGLENMHHMVSEANTEENKFRTYPMVSYAMLRKYSRGLILLSGCVSSYLSYLVNVQDDELNARIYVREMQSLFGDRFYLEVQPFESPGQYKLNQFCVKAGADYGIGVVMTSDAHYTDKDVLYGIDHGLTTYDAFLMAQKLRKGDRAAGTMMADYSERYLQSDEQMCKAWEQFMGTDGRLYWALSQAIAERCHIDIDITPKMPSLDWLAGADPMDTLIQLVEGGLKQRGKTSKKYAERAEYELEQINNRNFASYFLLVWDIVRYARSKDIPIWTRGSAGGSLVAYALWLNDVDPLEHNTSFDRFLAPGKLGLPDVDLDMSAKRREEVVAYVMAKYAGQAYKISTFGRWQAFSLVNALAKWLEMTEADIRAVKTILETKLAVDDIGIDPAILYGHAGLRALDDQYPGLIAYFVSIYGSINFMGTNAAGIVIVAGDITQYAPVIQFNKKFQIGWTKEVLEHYGFVKMDFLGVSGMDTIHEAEAAIKAAYGEEAIHPATYLTPQVLDAFAKGDTATVFQMEKWHVMKIYREMGAFDESDTAEAFRRIAAVNALIRPGSKAEGTDVLYIKAVQKKKSAKGLWAKFAQDTYGTFLYQEQIVDVCLYAGLGWPDIEKVLKFLKKKDPNHKIDVGIVKRFIDGMEDKGHDRKEAAGVFQHMLVYLFNRAHAVSYAMMAVRMMWLKIHYPIYWYVAVLNNEHVKKMRDIYLADAKQHGIRILNPQVNGGSKYRVALGGKYLQVGLVALDGIGPVIAESIDREFATGGPFASIEDFETRMSKTIQVTNGTGKPKEKRVYPEVGADVFKTLGRYGALEFDAHRFQVRTKQYNTMLLQTPVLIY